eukprot:COSAG01_NODE_6227_length_3780_cov_6.723988_6_plen_86_part_00
MEWDSRWRGYWVAVGADSWARQPNSRRGRGRTEAAAQRGPQHAELPEASEHRPLRRYPRLVAKAPLLAIATVGRLVALHVHLTVS